MDQWVDRLVAMEALVKRLIHTKEDLDQLEVEWLDEKDLAERFKSRPDKQEKIMQNGRQTNLNHSGHEVVKMTSDKQNSGRNGVGYSEK